MAKILVIDDEVAIRVVVRRALERAGHEVMEASDGDEGVRAYRKHTPDLTIIGILMPKKGGLVTIREIRAVAPSTKFIAMSGGGRRGQLDFLSTARTFPGVQTLRKPFLLTELVRLVNDMIGKTEEFGETHGVARELPA